MTNYFGYPYNNKTSSRKVLLSLIPTTFRNNSIEEPVYKIEERINLNGHIKENENLIQSELLVREKYRDKINRLNEIIEEKDNVISQIEIIAREKYGDKIDKLSEIIEEKDNAIKEIELYMGDLNELVIDIDTRMGDVKQELQWESKDIKELIKKEIHKVLLEIKENHKAEFHNILCGWLWKQVTIRINGFDIQGVLTKVSSEYLILFVSEDIFIIPIKRIDFAKRHA